MEAEPRREADHQALGVGLMRAEDHHQPVWADHQWAGGHHPMVAAATSERSGQRAVWTKVAAMRP